MAEVGAEEITTKEEIWVATEVRMHLVSMNLFYMLNSLSVGGGGGHSGRDVCIGLCYLR